MSLLFLKAVSRGLNILPRSFVLFIGDAVGWFWYTCLRFRRTTAMENLDLALGATLSPAERKAIIASNYRHYGRILVEIVLGATWSPDDYRRELVVEGLENILPFVKEGRGGIILTGHVGNWEMAIAAVASSGIPLDVVAKRLRNPHMNALLEWYRRRTGAELLAETGTAREILRSLSGGRFVAFILDQFMGPPIGLPVTFFGKPAGTAAALALITEKRDIPIVPVRSYRDAGGKLHSVFCPAVEFPPLSEDRNERLYQKTQLFNDILESHVRSHPDQWLWIHRRWKAYRGMPRWIAKSASTAVWAFVLGVIAGCSSPPGTTPTGILIPPDPKVEAPKIKQMETADEESREEVGISLAPTPTPKPTPEPKRKSRKTGAKEKEPAAVKQEVTTPPAPPVVQVMNVDRMPFEIGERMEIDLNWMALPAGRAILEVRSGGIYAGRPTVQLWGNILSSRLVDTIYHVDNTIESFVDAAGLIPYKFLLHMVETHQLKETRVVFDHTVNKAHYWSKRISQKWKDEEINREDSIAPLARDMWAAVYYGRALSYELNRKVTFPIYENGQNLDVELLPVANELVRTKAGVFQCWKIAVNIKLNNVLKPMGDVFMWLSDDSKKYIVKFDAKVKIGSLYGHLVELRERQ